MNHGRFVVFDVMAYDKNTLVSMSDLDLENSPHVIEVNAKIRFKTSAEGGRRVPVSTGYRPDHVFEYEDGKITEAWCGDISCSDSEIMDLGKEYEVSVRFVNGHSIKNYLVVGQKYFIHEGKKLVGEGEVTKV